MKSTIGILTGTLFLLVACTQEFEELNTNPNAPTQVQPALLLRQVIYSYADGMSYEGFTGGANLGQYFSAEPGFNAFDRGDLLAPQFGGNPWPLLYQNLRDIEIVLELARESTVNAVYEGPALVMKSIIAGTLTDLFGDIPYTEAAMGRSGLVTPRYDEQAAIYLGEGGLLDNLSTAVELMDTYAGVEPLEGDVLYNGDLEAWVRFANSLRLKYATRALDADQSKATAEVLEVQRDGRLILTNDQNAVFRFGSAPNDFRFARARLGDFTNYLMAETIDSVLDAYNDPREQLWFRESNAGGYNGVPNGLPDASLLDGGAVSLPGTIWREDAGQLQFPFMTAWETSFLLAELGARPIIFDNPAVRYDSGIELAFAYWGVALPGDYLSRPEIAYENGRALEQIATQRWLASIGNGYEGWIEWRRTGYPAFMQPLSSLNAGLIPIRFPYPADEQALNSEAYGRALEALGGENSPNVAVWWDR